MASWAGDPSFDLFQLPEEHQELRAAIRALSEKEIAPYAADVDENARFPEEALQALIASGFNAVHVPEEFGGQGADSVAACIVIEEVARVDASASLIPAVNKLGTMGLILRGSDELKKQVLPSIASGEAMASYALSEREAGSDAAAMRTRAKADGDDWILNGTKCWITNGGKSSWYTVMAVTDPDKGANGISAFMVHKDDEGFSRRPEGTQARHQGLTDHRAVLRELPGSRRPDHRRARHRVQDRAGHPGSHPPDHRRPGRRYRAGRAGRGDRLHQGPQAVRQEHRRFPGVQFMIADMAMKVEAARLMVYTAAARAERGEGNLGFISAASKCLASDVAMEVTTDAVQLFGGAGYTVDFPVERMMRDAKITQIYEGTNQIQRVVMSRALLK